MSETQFGADGNGVWHEHHAGDRLHVPWAEINCVSVAKYDCKTHVETILEFGHVSGYVLECNGSSVGYDMLIEAVGRQFSLPENWYSAVTKLSADDDALVIWQAAN